VAPGTIISIDDGKVTLTGLSLGEEGWSARVVRGGRIRKRKGINITPHPHLRTALSLGDTAIVQATAGMGHVRYALSFASSPLQIEALRAEAERVRGGKVWIATKLERGLTDDVMLAMGAVSDETWLCRGDLGAQLGLPGMVRLYRRFNTLVQTGAFGDCECTIAGEVLDHMCNSPIPTRAEVCNLGDCLHCGYTGAVLSNETAFGKYPSEAVAMVRAMLDDYY
ncbi:pyruvate kinase, partial [Kipferlia bialata]